MHFSHHIFSVEFALNVIYSEFIIKEPIAVENHEDVIDTDPNEVDRRESNRYPLVLLSKSEFGDYSIDINGTE